MRSSIRELKQSQLDRLVATLADFYRTAQRVFTVPAVQMAEWRRSLTTNNRILLEPRLGLPSALIRRVDRIQRSFLTHCPDLLAERVRGRRILDGAWRFASRTYLAHGRD